MTHRFVMTVIDQPGDRVVLVKGNIHDWLIERRVPARWSPVQRGWEIGANRIADIIALAEYDDVLVRIRRPAS